MNPNGSQLCYSKGDGPAPSTPISCSTDRKYFCTNGDNSSILLSRGGWVQYSNGAGAQCTLRADQLRWHPSANVEGWFAYAPAPVPAPTPVPTMAPGSTGARYAPRHRKDDSGVSFGDFTAQNHDRNDEDDSNDDALMRRRVCEVGV